MQNKYHQQQINLKWFKNEKKIDKIFCIRVTKAPISTFDQYVYGERFAHKKGIFNIKFP